jgi:hypothetical protein
MRVYLFGPAELANLQTNDITGSLKFLFIKRSLQVKHHALCEGHTCSCVCDLL